MIFPVFFHAQVTGLQTFYTGSASRGDGSLRRVVLGSLLSSATNSKVATGGGPWAGLVGLSGDLAMGI